MHAFELNWLQQTLLRSARRGAETEFSINWYTEEGDLRSPVHESILRARDGDNSLIQYRILFQLWKPIF